MADESPRTAPTAPGRSGLDGKPPRYLSVLVGNAAAERYLGWDGSPTRIYVRADVDQVTDVSARLAPTVNPAMTIVTATANTSASSNMSGAHMAVDHVGMKLLEIRITMNAVDAHVVSTICSRICEIGNTSRGTYDSEFSYDPALIATQPELYAPEVVVRRCADAMSALLEQVLVPA